MFWPGLTTPHGAASMAASPDTNTPCPVSICSLIFHQMFLCISIHLQKNRPVRMTRNPSHGVCKNQMKPLIPKAPNSFKSSLADLFKQHARHVLPAPDRVRVFHEMLRDYISTPDPVFLIRKVSKMRRGETIRSASGLRLRASDNAPAWWLHYQLYATPFSNPENCDKFIDSIPTHMFDVSLSEHINKAGWHVAHIYYAKDGNTDYQEWNHRELAWRMVRNIHPCNYFYIPKTNWQRYGGHPDVLSYFQQKYAEIYRDVWVEFLDMANASGLESRPGAETFTYAIPLKATQILNGNVSK